MLEFWHIVALEMALALIRSINPSASQSLLRELVPGNEIMNAVSLFTIGFNFARVVGPSLGGILMVWMGVSGCYLFYGTGLMISAIGMSLIRLPRREMPRREQDLLGEVREGFRYIRQAPVILGSIGAAYTLSIFVGTYQRFLPVFAKEILDVGPQGLGVLMAAPGLGAIVALMFLATEGERFKKEPLLWITATLMPVFLILFCLSHTFWLSVVFLALVGGGQIGFRTISRVIIQIEVPHHLLGRVMSVFVMDQGMRSIGSMIMGLFATLFGAALGLALTSILSLTLTSALFYRLLRPHSQG